MRKNAEARAARVQTLAAEYFPLRLNYKVSFGALITTSLQAYRSSCLRIRYFPHMLLSSPVMDSSSLCFAKLLTLPAPSRKCLILPVCYPDHCSEEEADGCWSNRCLRRGCYWPLYTREHQVRFRAHLRHLLTDIGTAVLS